MNLIRVRAVVVAIVAVGFVMSCRGERDPIRDTIETIAKEAENREAEKIIDHLSLTYRDASGMNRNETFLTVKRYLAGYQTIGVKISNLEIERAAESARATCHVEFTGRARKIGGLDSVLPDQGRYDFEISLLREGDAWNVSWASWKEVR